MQQVTFISDYTLGHWHHTCNHVPLDLRQCCAAAAVQCWGWASPPPPKPDAGSPAVHGKEAKDSKEATEAKAAKDAKEAKAAAEVAEGVREQAAIMRFIKNCVYSPSLPHASRYFAS